MMVVIRPRNHYALTPEHVIEIFNRCQFDDYSHPGVYVVVTTKELEVAFSPYSLRDSKAAIRQFLGELQLEFTSEFGTGVTPSSALVMKDGSKWSEHERHAEYLLMLGMAVGLVHHRTFKYEVLSGGANGQSFFIIDI